MKHIYTFTVIGILLFLLSGCDFHRRSQIIESEGVNYGDVYEEYYSDIEFVPKEGNICDDLEDSQKVYYEVDNLAPVDLDEMISDRRTNFIYGEVYKIEDYNCVNYNAYFKVFETGFSEDEVPLIRVIVMHSYELEEGKTYILNLTYSKESQSYALSKGYSSIFYEDESGNVVRSGPDDYGTHNLEEFLDEIFIR
ncbi:hypothetical protein KQ51_01367 [Candidatus Izimaplasma bacterium HR1]|jgi:hypothetical protein|uniref:hypothetical protein n=1 Tax=Candidatus Izimoplasma sp. HR1 TaxID=1541959 RepID=UPI0004F5EEF3|nr:hypothetical protein KQ51_01367 [Candidatus Izimaplasma bacterium HR1]